MKLRRCEENRWDFTEKDGAAFPIQLSKDGPTFGFCPAKVIRDDPETVSIYNTLTCILETGTWPEPGGLNNQDDFWVELVAEYGPKRRSMEFYERAKSILGTGKANGIGKK